MRGYPRGFTLVELVIVIVITALLAVVIGPLIGRGYSSVVRSGERAFWVQQAEYALFHLRQDLSQSVPNSVRIPSASNDAQAVEFLGFSQTEVASRLRYSESSQSGFNPMQTGGDDAFDVFADLSGLQLPVSISIAGNNATRILNDWQSHDAPGGVATVIHATVNPASAVTTLTLANSTHNFPNHSASFHAYLSDGPVAYQCADGFLWRHSGYTDVTNSDLTRRLSADKKVISARVIDAVQSCQFSWQAGTDTQPPSLRVQLSIGNAQEQIPLIDTLILADVQ